MMYNTITGHDFRNDKKLPPMKAIRRKCLECCAGSSHEVKECRICDCTLWPYRSGRAGRVGATLTEEQKAALRRTLEAARKKKDVYNCTESSETHTNHR